MIREVPRVAILVVAGVVVLMGALAGAGVIVRAGSARPPIVAIAFEGDPAPGAGGATMQRCNGGAFEQSTFDEPMTNAWGDVLFWTCLSDGGWALYLKPNIGPLTLIVHSGQTIGGVGTLPVSSTDFLFTDGPAINDRGTSIFAIRQGITGASAPESALFMKTASGSLQAALRTGDPSPCGGTYRRFDDMSLNNNDDVAIIATYNDVTPKAGVFLRLADGTVQAIICNNHPLPGTSGEKFIGTTLDSLDGPWLNDNRVVVFAADAISGPTALDPDTGVVESIWSGSTFTKRPGEAIESFIMVGDPLPGSVGGGVVSGLGIGRPAFNNSNALGFNLSRQTSTPSHPAEQFIASKQLGGPITICLEDFTPAPEGGNFDGFSSVAMNQKGDLQFTADINPHPVPNPDDTGKDNTRGIFTCNGGAVTTIVLQKDAGKPRGGSWSFELEEGSIGGPVVAFLDEVNFTGPSTERGVFRAGEPLTPTPTPTPSPTPTPQPGKQVKWGDVHCDGAVDSVDSLGDLRHLAQLPPLPHPSDCPEIGPTVEVTGFSPHPWGDVDCDGFVNSIDALRILRFVAHLSLTPIAGCPDVGAEVRIS